jgi:hypothetical protein
MKYQTCLVNHGGRKCGQQREKENLYAKLNKQHRIVYSMERTERIDGLLKLYNRVTTKL